MDEHTHCSCNGVWLCLACHGWAHQHPFEARGVGLVVSRYREPGSVPFHSYYGDVQPDCDGGFIFVE